MSKLSDFVMNAVLPTLEKYGEKELVKLLDKFKAADEEKYKASMIAGHAFIKPLIEYVKSTETEIDDGLVATINDAIEESASNNGITF
jgi:hypothetical protein